MRRVGAGGSLKHSKNQGFPLHSIIAGKVLHLSFDTVLSEKWWGRRREAPNRISKGSLCFSDKLFSREQYKKTRVNF